MDSVIFLQGCFSGEKTDDRTVYLQKYLFVALCLLAMWNGIHNSVKSQTRSGEQMLSAFCRTESIFIYHDQSDRFIAPLSRCMQALCIFAVLRGISVPDTVDRGRKI